VEGDTATNPRRKGFPVQALEAALRWNATGMGLSIFGPSGAGKSRIFWLLMRRLIVEDELDVEVLRGGEFRQRMIEAYRAERSELVIDRLSQVPVLAWDDFGQDALKAGMETDLRSIIDYRYNEGLPIVITTQFSPDELTQRLAGDDPARAQVCASIIRRISERSRVIPIAL
jgi:DNA replication protein DnaC/primosomal protein DnaI